MTIYILYYCFIIIFYYLTNNITIVTPSNQKKEVMLAYSDRPKNKECTFVVLSFGVLITILGLRHQSMGIDLVGYLPSFDFLGRLSWRELFEIQQWLNYEKGYVIFNKLVGLFSTDRQVFLFACALCSVGPIGFLFYKKSKNTLFSVLIYLALPVFSIVFSGLRQAIAIGITAFSYQLIHEKKLIRFVLIILFASTFHSSALLFLAAYPLYYLKLNNIARWLSVFLLPVIWALKTPLFTVLSKLVKDNAEIDNNNAITLFLVFLVIYIFCILFAHTEKKQVNGLLNLFWAACAIQAMGGVYSTVIRVGYYYMLPLTLLLPEVTSDMKLFTKASDRLILSIFIAICFLLFGLYTFSTDSLVGGNGYHFFWEVF